MQLLYQLEQYEETVNFFYKFTTIINSDNSSNLTEELSLLTEEQITKIIDYIKNNISTDCRSMYILGRLYLLLNLNDAAVKSFQLILNLDNQDVMLLHRIGYLEYARMNYITAEEFLNKALNQNPDNIDVLVTLGKLQYDTNKFDFAKNSFEQAIKVDTSDTKILNQIGDFYLNKGKTDESKIYFGRVIDIDKKAIVE